MERGANSVTNLTFDCSMEQPRAAMNAILYLLRTGCPWRYLPRESFPPQHWSRQDKAASGLFLAMQKTPQR